MKYIDGIITGRPEWQRQINLAWRPMSTWTISYAFAEPRVPAEIKRMLRLAVFILIGLAMFFVTAFVALLRLERGL